MKTLLLIVMLIGGIVITAIGIWQAIQEGTLKNMWMLIIFGIAVIGLNIFFWFMSAQ